MEIQLITPRYPNLNAGLASIFFSKRGRICDRWPIYSTEEWLNEFQFKYSTLYEYGRHFDNWNYLNILKFHIPCQQIAPILQTITVDD